MGPGSVGRNRLHLQIENYFPFSFYGEIFKMYVHSHFNAQRVSRREKQIMKMFAEHVLRKCCARNQVEIMVIRI